MFNIKIGLTNQVNLKVRKRREDLPFSVTTAISSSHSSEKSATDYFHKIEIFWQDDRGRFLICN